MKPLEPSTVAVIASQSGPVILCQDESSEILEIMFHWFPVVLGYLRVAELGTVESCFGGYVESPQDQETVICPAFVDTRHSANSVTFS